jgi:hypothetical protein
MSRHHAHLIRSIFHDPPSGNLHFREIESLLRHVGAELEPLSGGRVRARIGRMEAIVHHPHHGNSMGASAVLHLREFLARSGITPSAYENKDGTGSSSGPEGGARDA